MVKDIENIQGNHRELFGELIDDKNSDFDQTQYFDNVIQANVCENLRYLQYNSQKNPDADALLNHEYFKPDPINVNNLSMTLNFEGDRDNFYQNESRNPLENTELLVSKFSNSLDRKQS